MLCVAARFYVESGAVCSAAHCDDRFCSIVVWRSNTRDPTKHLQLPSSRSLRSYSSHSLSMDNNRRTLLHELQLLSMFTIHEDCFDKNAIRLLISRVYNIYVL